MKIVKAPDIIYEDGCLVCPFCNNYLLVLDNLYSKKNKSCCVEMKCRGCKKIFIEIISEKKTTTLTIM